MRWVCTKCNYELKDERKELEAAVLNGCPKCGCFAMKVEDK